MDPGTKEGRFALTASRARPALIRGGLARTRTDLVVARGGLGCVTAQDPDAGGS